jgi:Uma2 family endonuclease
MVTVPYEHRHLPTAEDLPDSDETPVDNELQNDIPNILLNLLRSIWGDRQNWFWGVDMCFYYEPNIKEPEKSKAIVPDAFLALGVERLTNEGGRLSYVLWQEKVLPILALEVISKKYNGEYDRKLLQYQDLGILYYIVYNTSSGRRGLYKKHQSLEVYKLINSKYELVPSVSLLQEGGKMVWMPEVGLGIGCEHGNRGNWEREWVYWYDRNSVRYPTAEERAESAEERAESAHFAQKQAEMIAEQERQQKLQERQQKEKLATYLKSLGINPDEI